MAVAPTSIAETPASANVLTRLALPAIRQTVPDVVVIHPSVLPTAVRASPVGPTAIAMANNVSMLPASSVIPPTTQAVDSRPPSASTMVRAVQPVVVITIVMTRRPVNVSTGPVDFAIWRIMRVAAGTPPSAPAALPVSAAWATAIVMTLQHPIVSRVSARPARSVVTAAATVP